jgi:hypothetical protein
MFYKNFASAFLSLILLSGGLQAQFARTYGGKSLDSAISILATPDDGFLVFGSTTGFELGTTLKPCLIKLAPDGSLEWAKIYMAEGLLSLDSACRDTDGGYIMAGGTLSSVWLAKTDPAGDVLWREEIVNSRGSVDRRYRLYAAGDGGCFLVGSRFSDSPKVWVVKLGPSGNVIWQRVFGLGSEEYGMCGEAAADGGVAIAGLSGQNMAFVFKIGPAGDISLQKTYQATDFGWCNVISLSHSEGGYWLSGTLANNDDWGGQSGQTGFAYKIGDDGALLRTISFAGVKVWSGSGTSDGGLVAGGTVGDAPSTNAFVVKFSPDGEIEWQNAFGGFFEEEGTAVVQTSAEDYAAAGFTKSFGAGDGDFLVIRISSDGVLGSCRFCTGSNCGISAASVIEGDLSLSGEETAAVPETGTLEAVDISELVETYRLCADEKLLTISATLPGIEANTTTPPLGTHIYAADESVTLTAVKALAYGGGTYKFSNWGGDIYSAVNATTITITDDISIQVAYYQVTSPVTPNPPDGGDLPEECFIATAAFGSPLDPAVKLLREFRDKRLLTNGVGRAFVAAYYRWSPPAADFIARSGALRLLVCVLLFPVVATAFLVLKLGWIPAFLLIAVVTAAIARRKSLRRRLRPA